MALAVHGHANRHDGRVADHAAIDPHLVIRRVQPDVRIRGRQATRAKRLHHRVEIGADPRHLGLRDPVEPERLHQVVHLPAAIMKGG